MSRQRVRPSTHHRLYCLPFSACLPARQRLSALPFPAFLPQPAFLPFRCLPSHSYLPSPKRPPSTLAFRQKLSLHRSGPATYGTIAAFMATRAFIHHRQRQFRENRIVAVAARAALALLGRSPYLARPAARPVGQFYALRDTVCDSSSDRASRRETDIRDNNIPDLHRAHPRQHIQPTSRAGRSAGKHRSARIEQIQILRASLPRARRGHTPTSCD